MDNILTNCWFCGNFHRLYGDCGPGHPPRDDLKRFTIGNHWVDEPDATACATPPVVPQCED